MKPLILSLILAASAFAVTFADVSGSAQKTPPTATIVAGSNVVIIPTPLDFKNGHGVFITNAGSGKSVGPSGSPFCSTIISGGGTTTLTLADAVSVGSSLAVVAHDDGAAEQAGIDAVSAQPYGGELKWPAGDFSNNCFPLHSHAPNIQLIGAGRASTTLRSEGNFDYGMGFVSTMAPNGPLPYVLPGTYGPPLLSGPGNSFDVTASAPRGWLSFRQCKLYCGDLNGLGAFTAETTFKLTALTERVSLLTSSGKRDSITPVTHAFVLSVNATGSFHCELTTSAGTKGLTSANGLIVPGVIYHAALSYDGANQYCFVNGSQVSSPMPQTGTVVQDDMEDVKTHADMSYFPDGGFFTYQAPKGQLDGVRLSNVARYVTNFAAPTAKWGPPDNNTWISCNFDNQQDIFTVCKSTNGGGAYKNVYLPLLGSSCGGGDDNTVIKGLNFSHSDGWFINHNPGTQLSNVGFTSSHNGLLFGGCSYWTRMYDIVFSGPFGGRFGLAQTQGILEIDNIEFTAMAASVGAIFGGNAVINNVLYQAGGNNPKVGLLFRAAGAQTIAAIKPSVIINFVHIDVEEPHVNFYTPIMLDQVSGILNGVDSECAVANAGCFPLVVHGPAFVELNAGGYAGGSSIPGLIHTAGAPIVVVNGAQNPQNKPWCDIPGKCWTPMLQPAP